MDKIISISNQTGKFYLILDGRDKFTKAIQYGSRLLAWSFQGKNEAMERRFRTLFSNFLIT
jgi:hypothetical protein